MAELCPENRFELVFDEKIEGPMLLNLHKEMKEQNLIENPQSGMLDSS
jgi:hypothetical protein